MRRGARRTLTTMTGPSDHPRSAARVHRRGVVGAIGVIGLIAVTSSSGLAGGLGRSSGAGDPVGAAVTTTTGGAGPTTVAAGAAGAATVTPSTTPLTSNPAVTATTPSTTVAGPPPRATRRVATDRPTEKIRATSLPLRRMGITLGLVVAGLVVSGFVYGRVRSRIPAVTIPRVGPAAGGPTPAAPGRQATPVDAPTKSSPPPPPRLMPPPIAADPATVTGTGTGTVEDARADTVIFERPPDHPAPAVISEPAPPAPIEDAELVGHDGTADGPRTTRDS